MRELASWAVGLAFLGGCAAAQQAPLDALGATVNAIHGGERVARLPAVEGLVGARRSALVEVLGAPRDCELPLEEPCRSVGETIWVLGGGDTGEFGPVLVVRLDATRRVTEAGWRNDPVAAPAPLAVRDDTRPTSASTEPARRTPAP